MAKTTVIAMTGFIEYARVFTDNMDANMDFHAKTEGQYNVNFYPETDEDFDKFFGAGAPPSAMGHDTIKVGNSELASGKYLKLKRPNKHPSGIEDCGGAPLVFDFREGESTKKWSFSEAPLSLESETSLNSLFISLALPLAVLSFVFCLSAELLYKLGPFILYVMSIC